MSLLALSLDAVAWNPCLCMIATRTLSCTRTPTPMYLHARIPPPCAASNSIDDASKSFGVEERERERERQRETERDRERETDRGRDRERETVWRRIAIALGCRGVLRPRRVRFRACISRESSANIALIPPRGAPAPPTHPMGLCLAHGESTAVSFEMQRRNRRVNLRLALI